MDINNANDNDTNVINADNNSSNANSNRNDDHDAYEKVCYVCRRPESKAGKMITMPGGMCLCHDCMQKSFDAIMKNGMDFLKMRQLRMRFQTVSCIGHI